MHSGHESGRIATDDVAVIAGALDAGVPDQRDRTGVHGDSETEASRGLDDAAETRRQERGVLARRVGIRQARRTLALELAMIAAALFVGFPVYVLVNLAVDLGYALLDPRVRIQ